MASVDDRIVAMKFDNAAFQEKVAATIASLDKLKTSVDNAGKTHGLTDLQASARGFSLEGMASQVEGIAGKFTAMGAIAFSVLQNITNRAISAGVSIAKSLSLDQVLSGYHEYETNLNSIQTIMANTRSDNTTLEQVNDSLQTLNEYSDQTIYNFSQMARNIGTFTAAGVNLDTSVGAIKGIANLAAVSGSNAEQASSAMYQLSQALASGSVKLMDWNSIVNAGMGGQVFQEALFTTGKALGTLKDVKLDQTFEDWKNAGNTFRGSLEDGWITADVLTQTLSGFTGDLTEAQVKALGYTDEQTKQILDMGKTAKAAATEVKTLTQLVGTVKESIGSGWTQSFAIVFGNFNEAKKLFTGVNDAIGEFVGKNAEARNALLQSWKDLGGRELLIDGIKTGFQSLLGILKPIHEAFREIFPKKTALDLLSMTHAFHDFVEAMKPSPAQAVLITRTFRGLFAAFDIGIMVVKGIFGFFRELINVFDDRRVNDSLLTFTANIGDFFTGLRDKLKSGEVITNFFSDLAVAIGQLVRKIAPYFDEARDKIGQFFDWVTGIFGDSGEGSKAIDSGSGIIGAAVDRIGERFAFLIPIAHAVGAVFEWIADKMEPFRSAISTVVDWLRDKVVNLPQEISNALAKTDYSVALDTVNTGLFAGLVLLFAKFMKNNPLKKLGSLIDGIKKTLGGLTDTLQAMQTKLKSEALMNIAKAVGVLTVSVLILSLIDSAALTKSMVAMAVGFGQLVTVMALLNTVTAGPGAAAKLGALATGITILAAAMVLLAIAAKIFSTMSWEELAKGLVSVTVLLGVLDKTVKPIATNSGGMITAGLGIIAISIALNILALAVKSFAEMSWGEMAKGLVGVGGGLLVITEAMRYMPGKDMIGKGAGVVLIAIGLNIMAAALKSFAEMSWGEMAKGMVGTAGGLFLISDAMDSMPALFVQAAGLVLMGVALNLIAKAVGDMGALSWKAIGKGLVGLAGALLILSIAADSMIKSIPGAVAIGIMAFSLDNMANVMKKMGKLSWSEIIRGMGAFAVILGVMAVAALLLEPAIGALLLLGIALTAVGVGMALFGLGANLLATAFAIIATAGTEGIKTLASVLDLLIQRLPALIAALGDGLIELGQKILEAAPGLITQLSGVVKALIQLFIDNIPGMVDAVIAFVRGMLDAITTLFPDIVAAGLGMLVALLQGIRDNIFEITSLVVEIITEFLTALGTHAEELVTAGLSVLTSLLEGIGDNITDVVTSVGTIITKFVTAVGAEATRIVTAGAHALEQFLEGIGDNLIRVAHTAVDVVIKFINALADETTRLANAGLDVIIKLIKGITDAIDSHIDELRDAGWKLAGAIVNGLTLGLAGKAKEIAGSVKDALVDAPQAIIGKGWLWGSPSKVAIQYGSWIAQGVAIGLDEDTTAERSAENFSNRVSNTMQSALGQAAMAMENMEEFQPVIRPVLDMTGVERQAKDVRDFIATTIPYETTQDMVDRITHELTAQFAGQFGQERQVDSVSISPDGTPVVTYIQNNYSPDPLSPAYIYRQTKNQIAMKQEELAQL